DRFRAVEIIRAQLALNVCDVFRRVKRASFRHAGDLMPLTRRHFLRLLDGRDVRFRIALVEFEKRDVGASLTQLLDELLPLRSVTVRADDVRVWHYGSRLLRRRTGRLLIS